MLRHAHTLYSQSVLIDGDVTNQGENSQNTLRSGLISDLLGFAYLLEAENLLVLEAKNLGSNFED